MNGYQTHLIYIQLKIFGGLKSLLIKPKLLEIKQDSKRDTKKKSKIGDRGGSYKIKLKRHMTKPL